ncbi:MAG: OmpA family protein, partial [Chitinophagales bacterium]|nr:OmpA family protein [Chitinophagales bacterium]
MLLSFAFIINAGAQTIDKKWNIGLHAGATQYKGDLGNDFYRNHMALYGFGGISVSRYMASHFDLSLSFNKGTVGYNRDSAGFKRNFTTGALDFRFNITGPNAMVRPYLFIGGGAMLFDKNLDLTEKKIDYIAPEFGVGVNVKLGSSVMFNLQECFVYTTGDERDGVVANENDAFLFHKVGLTFNFGKAKDADGDGVADRNDECAETPAGVTVDKTGCPLDKDADGIADYLDTCPDVAGTKLLNGCPDTDGDGIADKDDRCPEVAGLSTLKGCPDEDGDGIADLDDKCLGTKTGYRVDATGCPMDNDKDGILNEDDLCPDAAGILELKGCPDTDGDCISDKDDRCPTVKGTIANKGCPEMAKEDVKKITMIASKIYFEFNISKLKAVSLPQLDALVEILKKYEAANLAIEGHTDNIGEDAYNMNLSQERTESVKDYLMSKGIMESRLSAKGFAETQQIADNKNKAGHAKNRRV